MRFHPNNTDMVIRPQAHSGGHWSWRAVPRLCTGGGVLCMALFLVSCRGTQGVEAGRLDADLHWAVMNGRDPAQVKALLEQGAGQTDPERMAWTFHNALVFRRDIHRREIIMHLLRNGVDPNAKLSESRVVDVAFRGSQLSAVDVAHLVGYGLDINGTDRSGSTLLHWAVRWRLRSPDMVRTLLANGANPNIRDSRGETPLYLALQSIPGAAAPEVVRLLITHGADPNIRDNKGHTPLAGYTFRREEVVLSLVEAGADLSDPSVAGMPLLMEAASRGQHKAVAAMLAHGANPNAGDKWSTTPVFRAASAGDLELDELLVAKGADVNHTNSGGFTPLHFAAARFHRKIASYLIEQGAKLDACDSKGLTPLAHARARGVDPKSDQPEQKAAMIAFLQAQGAE